MAYEYPSNFSNGTRVDDLGGMMGYMNYITGGTFAYGLLVCIFFISSLPFMQANARKAFTAGFFITAIFAVFFARIGMVSTMVPVYLAVATVVTAFFSKGEGNSNM